MIRTFTHRLGLVVTIACVAMAAALWAQEPRVEQRGFVSLRGNIIAASGVVVSGGGASRDFRTNTVDATAGAATFTAAEVLSGLIQRTPGAGGNVTDVMPTAANLIAAMPGVVTGHSFWVLVDMGASPGGTSTLSGASTGVTYSGGCGTAQGTSDAMLVLVNITSSTTYRAVCVNVNT